MGLLLIAAAMPPFWKPLESIDDEGLPTDQLTTVDQYRPVSATVQSDDQAAAGIV